MPRFRRAAAFPAIAAALSMTAMPVAAASLQSPASSSYAPADAVWSEAGQSAHQFRRHHHRYDRYRHRHRDRVDAGDVLAGVLIIGGIAAFANAVKKDRARDYRDRDYRYRDRDTGDWRGREGPAYRERSGLENAAAICAAEVEREVRVAAIDRVERDAAGWQVEGTLADGAGFICRIGPDGRVADIDYSLRRDRSVTRDDPFEENYGY